MMGYEYGHMWFGALWMLIFCGALVWFIVWLVKKNYAGQITNETKKPIEVINERLAKGDITIKEYKEMKEILK